MSTSENNCSITHICMTKSEICVIFFSWKCFVDLNLEDQSCHAMITSSLCHESTLTGTRHLYSVRYKSRC